MSLKALYSVHPPLGKTLGDSFEKQGKNQPMHWVILFHGYGSDAADLMQLRFLLALRKSCHWLCLEGPLEVEPFGKSWFPINLFLLQDAYQKKEFEGIRQHVPLGIDEIHRKVWSDLKEKINPQEWSQVILGGFSQGAILALDLCSQMPVKPKALMLFSTTCLCEKRWQKGFHDMEGMPFFQSHGMEDPVLSYHEALYVEKLLKQKGLKGNLHSFRGGHEIPSSVLSSCSEWVNGLL